MAERKRAEQYPFQKIFQRTGIETTVLNAGKTIQKKLLGSITLTRTYVDQSEIEQVTFTPIEDLESVDTAHSIQQTTTIEEHSTDSLTVGLKGVKLTNQINKRRTNKVTVVTGDPEKDAEIFKRLGLTTPTDSNEPK
jgi:hypothetical protein